MALLLPVLAANRNLCIECNRSRFLLKAKNIVTGDQFGIKEKTDAGNIIRLLMKDDPDLIELSNLSYSPVIIEPHAGVE